MEWWTDTKLKGVRKIAKYILSHLSSTASLSERDGRAKYFNG